MLTLSGILLESVIPDNRLVLFAAPTQKCWYTWTLAGTSFIWWFPDPPLLISLRWCPKLKNFYPNNYIAANVYLSQWDHSRRANQCHSKAKVPMMMVSDRQFCTESVIPVPFTLYVLSLLRFLADPISVINLWILVFQIASWIEEIRHHRHWQRVLELVSGCKLSMLNFTLPDSGTSLGGSVSLHGNNLTLACYHGINFRSKSWALFTLAEPNICFATGAQEGKNSGMCMVDTEFN